MSIMTTLCSLGIALGASHHAPQVSLQSPFQIQHVLTIPPPIEFTIRANGERRYRDGRGMHRTLEFDEGELVDTLTPEYCEHVMVIAEEIDPAIAAYLKTMCEEDPEGFERVIRRQGKRLGSLMRLKETDPMLYDIRLSGLKTDAEIIRVTQALQIAGPDDPQLQANAAELRALIGARIKNATKAKKLDIKRLEKHIAKLKAEIDETESSFDELVEKRFNQLFDVVQDTNSTPKEE